MTNSVDVLIVGGGPAGACGAIRCAQWGLRTVLLERENFPRNRPGESLHPGFDALLDQLDVRGSILSAGFPRFDGNSVTWKNETTFEGFTAARNGQARGLQAFRPEFDAILLEHARKCGVEIIQPARAFRPIVSDGRVIGAETEHGRIESAFLIDAAGRGQWLAQHLNLDILTHSPRLIAHFAYMRGECPARDDNPGFFIDEIGWTWTARVADGLYNWTRLNVHGEPIDKEFRPAEFHSLSPSIPVRTADVTWRFIPACAGEGYFLCGDAAAVLDPTSSHGVVKAIMSGMQAADLIFQVLKQEGDKREAISTYRELFSWWFRQDVTRLRGQYEKWFGVQWARSV